MTAAGSRWRQMALLAALLDADGRLLTYVQLGDVVGSRGIDDAVVIRQYVYRLRHRGIAGIEIVKGRGCRLTALPPDEILEDVLAVLDALRRDGYRAPVALRRAS